MNLRIRRTRTFAVYCLLLAISSAIGFGLASNPPSSEVPRSASPKPAIDSTETKAACELIYDGKFEAAGELVKRSANSSMPEFVKLKEIVEQYQSLQQHRQAANEAAYMEQFAELGKLRVKAASNPSVADPNINSIKDVNDVNDVNDIVTAFSVIVKASEFADDKQKTSLMSDDFVKSIFKRGKNKAVAFEAGGKWLDAHLVYYYWLQAIEPDNREYADYSEQLLDKAGIVASFQDSPCETRQERYAAVDKEIFIKAVNALNFSYVRPVDYRQMAAKAVKRCKLLAEVIDLSYSEIVENGTSNKQPTAQSAAKILTRPDRTKLAAWSMSLTEILNEFNELPIVGSSKFIGLFENVLSLNATTIELPEKVLISQFSEAALGALDPYTVIIWPKQVQDFEKIMTNEFSGIGVEISREKGQLTVSSLLPDTPAYNSGLDAGDLIKAVDGIDTKDMSLACAVKNITGPAGTKVALTINRPSEERTFDITLTRASIIVQTIRGWQRTEGGKWLYIIDNRNQIGYIRMTSFSEKTAEDFKKVLKQLEEEGMKGLVLDLRFNTGGLLDSAVDVAEKFLKQGVIVSTCPRLGDCSYAYAHKEGTCPDYPLVVLINAGSASASEIVAGALADKVHKRAVLVGERTHGKGSVQGVTPYIGGRAQMKYTMAYYHLPSGQRVEGQEEMKKTGRKDWGVAPNVEVKLRSDELKNMLDTERDNDVLVRADHGSNGASLKKHTVEETLMADPQLAVGLLVVRSKLVQSSLN